MANLSFILGVIGNVISILLFASPISKFFLCFQKNLLGVIKKKSTGDYKGEPYITTLLSTSLWTLYGIINPDGLLVMTVNGAGAILQLIYVILFLVYAPKDAKVKAAKLVCVVNVGVLGTVTAVTLFAVHKNTRLTFVGILCTALTIGMYASPLSAMVSFSTCISKSTRYMFNPNKTQPKDRCTVFAHLLTCKTDEVGSACSKLNSMQAMKTKSCRSCWNELNYSYFVHLSTVVKTKSVEYMPFLLSLLLFLNAGVWSVYAVLVKDIYIGVPNAVGLFLGSAQLILYVIYKNKPVSTNPSEAIEEEEEEEEGGSAHPARRGIEMNSSLGNV
ncbi:hypothetical protein GOBAR_AA00123 [Gossypium barbadense]|uniref:Bidirectional sugar transporter SWEET n=1 Tax=Gossypium barbadense TaxID=3634 RepID=A0A2P5YY15_GOSBA|nr:hypothetical protein GOBAR_AA00123 [Gossypium barbadense]